MATVVSNAELRPVESYPITLRRQLLISYTEPLTGVRDLYLIRPISIARAEVPGVSGQHMVIYAYDYVAQKDQAFVAWLIGDLYPSSDAGSKFLMECQQRPTDVREFSRHLDAVLQPVEDAITLKVLRIDYIAALQELAADMSWLKENHRKDIEPEILEGIRRSIDAMFLFARNQENEGYRLLLQNAAMQLIEVAPDIKVQWSDIIELKKQLGDLREENKQLRKQVSKLEREASEDVK